MLLIEPLNGNLNTQINDFGFAICVLYYSPGSAIENFLGVWGDIRNASTDDFHIMGNDTMS